MRWPRSEGKGVAVGEARRNGALARAAILAPALVASSAAGCASHCADLRPEADIPWRAELIQEAEAIPVRVRRIEAGPAGGPSFRLAVEERGEGDRDRVLVFVHGINSDRSIWRFMVGELGREQDLVLVDLPGCGQSEGPDPDAAADAYTPDGMATAVLRVLRTVLKERSGEPRVTLIGHSLGTTVIFRMFGSPACAAEFADVLRRVDRTVLFCPVDFTVEKRDPVFDGLADLGSAKVAIADALGILESEVVKANVEGVADPASLPRE